MPRSKTILSAAILALALSAAGSASASAAGWMVNGSELSGSINLANTAVVVGGQSILKAEGVTVTCTASTLKGTNPKLTSPNEGSAESLEFTGCSASAPCTLNSSTITTVPIMFVTTAGISSVTAQFLPATGTVFASVPFTGGGTCAFKGKTPVTGKVTVDDCKGQEEATWQTVTSLATEASDEVKLGSAPAELESEVELKLENSEPWSFL